MSDSIRAGEFRICPSCGSRNKAAHQFCVRCSASLHAAPATVPAAGAGRSGNTRMMRFLLAAGVIAAIGVGLIVHTVFRATLEVTPISEDVRADSARTVSAPPPPPEGLADLAQLGGRGWRKFLPASGGRLRSVLHPAR